MLKSSEPITAEEYSQTELDRRFEWKGLLGQGGMGQVHAARDRNLGRLVAVKFLREGLHRNASLVGRFLREAQVGGQLEHPYIVPVYSFDFAQEGSPAFVMKLVSDRTLADYIDECRGAAFDDRAGGGALSLKNRLSHILPVCDAISYAHARGVVHRDLKPENIMLGGHNEVMVADWGIARIVDDETEGAERTRGDASIRLSYSASMQAQLDELVADANADTLAETESRAARSSAPPDLNPQPDPTNHRSQEVFRHEAHSSNRFRSTRGIGPDGRPISSGSEETRAGSIVGTLQYMAPEQAAGENVGPAADQFALGLICYELAKLEAARPNGPTENLIVAAIRAEHRGLRDDGYVHTGDRRLNAILTKALAPLAKDRYPSVEAFGDDLRRFIQDEEISVQPDGFARKTLRRMQRHPAISVGALSFLLLTLSLATIWSLRQTAARDALATMERENLSRLSSKVSEAASRADALLLNHKAQVVGLARSTEAVLRHTSARDATSVYTPADFDTRTVPGTEEPNPIRSFRYPVTLNLAESDTGAREAAQKLAAHAHELRATVLRSIDPDYLKLTPAQHEDLLRSSHDGLARLGVLLDSGVYVQFPGRGGISRDSDPRQAPWYRDVHKRGATHFEPPLFCPLGEEPRLSITAALYQDGSHMGAVEGELALGTLVERIQVQDEPGLKAMFIADSSGQVVASRALLDETTARGGKGGEYILLPTLPSNHLAARLKGTTAGGYMIEGESLFVFEKLSVEDWWCVGIFETAKYLPTVKVVTKN